MEDHKDYLYQRYLRMEKCVSLPTMKEWLDQMLELMYPVSKELIFQSAEDLGKHADALQMRLGHIIACSLPKPDRADAIAQAFFADLPHILTLTDTDVDAIYQGDPAARSHNEVMRSYPGFRAIAAHRIAHHLYKQEVPVVPRLISEAAHSETGIDIHPGAEIDEAFCIDHGTGVVIGETARIGKRVKIYQGVTLGGLSVRKEDADKRRHPTLEDEVVVYAGATILGGDTRIGKGAIIGGNTFITRSVPAGAKVYYSNDKQETKHALK